MKEVVLLTLKIYDIEFTEECYPDGNACCLIYQWMWENLGPRRLKNCDDPFCHGTEDYYWSRHFKVEEHYEHIFPVWKIKNDEIRRKFIFKLYNDTYPLNTLIDRLKVPEHDHDDGLWNLWFRKTGYDEYEVKLFFYSLEAYERFYAAHKDFIEKRKVDVDISGETD